MKDHALIKKFIWFWPTEKALQGWIAVKWKPKGHINLKLGTGSLRRYSTASKIEIG